MTKSVIGVYDSLETARSVVSDLVDAGFDRNTISIVAHDPDAKYASYVDRDLDAGDDVAAGAGIGAAIGGIGGLLLGLGALAIPGIGPVIAAGPIVAALTGAGLGAVAGGAIGALVDLGIPEEDAHLYAESVRRGNILVTAQVPDNRVDKASKLMERAGLIDLEHHSATWRSEGWTGAPVAGNGKIHKKTENVMSAVAQQPSTSVQSEKTRQPIKADTKRTIDGTETIEVIEEDIKIGKRAVEEGGVRVRSFVREVPVEEEVSLREERVSVERRPVDRPARPEDLNAFKEGTVEMTERSEQAVISKEARVVEEVVVSKDVNVRTETVRDSVRKTEVEVERTGGNGSTVGYDTYNQDFQTHFQKTFSARGAKFDRYQPAYRYGYTIANDQRYRGRNWNDIEADIHRDWDTRNQGPWEDFKDAVSYSWNKVTGKI